MPDVSSYSDINAWWRGEGVCSNAGWRLEREMKEERRKEEEERSLSVITTSDKQIVQGSV